MPTLSPIFNPSLLDCRASGNIDTAKPDPSILAIAQSVPHTRYDYWAPAANAPLWAQKAMEISPEINPTTIRPPGTPIPWVLWD